MKYLIFFFLVNYIVSAHAQQGYPTPPSEANRLFYIQHSDNHNTFVYNANLKNGIIQVDDPLEIYRIAYTEGGKKMPLNPFQKALAFGMDIISVSGNLYEMELVASKKVRFYMMLDKAGKPKVYTTINNKKMYLDRIFLKLKEGTSGMGINLDYALFFGQDFVTGQNVTEKMADW